MKNDTDRIKNHPDLVGVAELGIKQNHYSLFKILNSGFTLIKVFGASMVKNTKNSSNRKSFGFTLIELLVVISIIGILAGLVAVSYTRANKQARDVQRKNDLKQYQVGLENYSANNGSGYPSRTTGAGVTASVTLCADLGQYVAGCPEDPRAQDDSSQRYFYQSDGTNTGTASALNFTLWTKLESNSNYWVVCSSGKSGEKAVSGFSVTGGACPL